MNRKQILILLLLPIIIFTMFIFPPWIIPSLHPDFAPRNAGYHFRYDPPKIVREYARDGKGNYVELLEKVDINDSRLFIQIVVMTFIACVGLWIISDEDRKKDKL